MSLVDSRPRVACLRTLTMIFALFLIVACGDSGTVVPFEPDADVVVSPEVVEPDVVELQPCLGIGCGIDPATGENCGVCPDGFTCSEAGQCQPTPAGCDNEGFNMVIDAMIRYSEGLAYYEAMTSESQPFDRLEIEVYEDWTGAAIQPGVYDLTGINYADCANCVLAYEDVTDDGYARQYYAEEGILVVEEYTEGGRFTGVLSNVVLNEVTINSNNWVSTRVPGGKTWCIDEYAFDVEWPLPPPPPEFPVHEGEVLEACSAQGTGTLVGANIGSWTLPNCYGEMIDLHSGCDSDAKALWLFGTAGWCTACEARLAELASQHGGSLSREIISAQTPGLDMFVLLTEDQLQQPPTAAYCEAYATSKNLDPAMVLMDWAEPAAQIPLVLEPEYVLEINPLGNTWSVLEPYMAADQFGDVYTYFPWEAVLHVPNMVYVWSSLYQDAGLDDALDAAMSGTLPGGGGGDEPDGGTTDPDAMGGGDGTMDAGSTDDAATADDVGPTADDG